MKKDDVRHNHCWNCHKRFTSSRDDIKLYKDYYDENYFAMVCPDCGAHSTITWEELDRNCWWDYSEKKLKWND
jgi:hypothetical protein